MIACKETILRFQKTCRQFLFTLGLGDLRNYGREMGVARPTARKKEDLIEEIILILSGELKPIPVSRQGAPVKNKKVDIRIPKRIAEIQREFFGVDGADSPVLLARAKKEPPYEGVVLRFAENADESYAQFSDVVRTGQVSYEDGVYRLLPVNLNEGEETVFIPADVVENNFLRDGDVISCYTRKTSEGATVVADVEVINGFSTADGVLARPDFEECIACSPRERIHVFDGERYVSITQKFVEWLMPIGRGQRACVISSPKAGKTRFLLEVAIAARELNEGLDTLVLLVDESPETVGEFQRALGTDDLFYTTYDDEPERHVELAEQLLKRAKRKAESGADVLLVLDSLNALARAYNDTDESIGGKTMPCGLEVKTLRFIKKYFGTARRLEKGGSVTILGALSANTGNPIDEVLTAELSAQANVETRLNDALARRRIYPAVELSATENKQGDLLQSGYEQSLELRLRRAEGLSTDTLVQLLAKVNDYDAFAAAVEKTIE